MFGSKKNEAVVSNEPVKTTENTNTFLKRSQRSIKDIIAPGGIDAS